MQEVRHDGTKGPIEPLNVKKMERRLKDPKVKQFIVAKRKELQKSIKDLDLKIEKLEPDIKGTFEDTKKELMSSIKKLEDDLKDLEKGIIKPVKKLSKWDQKSLQYKKSLKKRRTKNKMAKRSRQKNR